MNGHVQRIGNRSHSRDLPSITKNQPDSVRCPVHSVGIRRVAALASVDCDNTLREYAVCGCAEVLQESGVPAQSILLEEASHDTLQSVRNCSRILHSMSGFSQVVVCSDVYHIPRCRWLLKLYGIPSLPGEVSSGKAQNKAWRWWYYCLRELPGLVWDTLVVLISGRSSRPGGRVLHPYF